MSSNAAMLGGPVGGCQGAIGRIAALAGAAARRKWLAPRRSRTMAGCLIYANMESFFAVLAAALLLGEQVAVTSIVGGAAVVAGVLLTRRPG